MSAKEELYNRFEKQIEYLGVNKPVNKIIPIVSVTVATYQHKNYINECLDGILMQRTAFPVEIIIGEDQSTDGTREICIDYAKKNPNRIRLFLRDRKLSQYCEGGKFVCRFNGIWNRMSARGKYIAWCEGDDYWTDPFKLQKQIDFLEANPDYSICFHNVKVLNHGKLVDDFITRKVPESTDIYELTKGNFIHTPSCVFRNTFKDGKIPDILVKVPLGDYALHMINAQYGKIKKLDDFMAVYRVHPLGVHSSYSVSKKCLATLHTCDYLIEYFNNNILVQQKLKDYRWDILKLFSGILFDSKLYVDIGSGYSVQNSIVLKNFSSVFRNEPSNIQFKLDCMFQDIKEICWNPACKPCRCKIEQITYTLKDNIEKEYSLKKLKTNGSNDFLDPTFINFNTENPQVFLFIKGNIKSIKIKALIIPKSYKEIFNELSNCYNSLSWKVTAPLRRLKSMLRKIK